MTERDQLSDDELHGIHGDCKADPLRGQNHRRVHAYHGAARVEQWPARVARIQRRVGLNDVVDQPTRHGAKRAAERADDAGGDRALKAQRIADRDDDLPHA